MYKIILVVTLQIMQCHLENLNLLIVPKIYVIPDEIQHRLLLQNNRSPVEYQPEGHIARVREDLDEDDSGGIDMENTGDIASGDKTLIPEADDKIVGGKEVDINLYPYHVGYGANCGGAIIHKKWVVTAAHCGKKPFVRSGSKYLNQGKRTMVKNYYPHPTWGGKKKEHAFDYDYQLLELKDMLVFNDNTRPIKVARMSDMLVGKMITVTGWGNTEEDGPYSDVLRAVRVPIIPKKNCQAVNHPYFQGKLTQRMFCAGYLEGKKDACQGDSGGPAVSGDRLMGTVSFGYGCAQPGSYGVYSKLAAARPWIKAITGLDLP